jgi:hypothetical protein
MSFFSGLKKYFSQPAFSEELSKHNLSLVNNKIAPPYSCELDIVDHCNIVCADCNHASPVIKKRYTNPEETCRDLSLLAKVYEPQVIKILGGEPLLHPDLPGIFSAIRRSGFCSTLYLITNGLLLPKQGEDFWKAIDILEISCYPDSSLTDEQLRDCLDKAKQYDVTLYVYYYEQFRPTFVMKGYEHPDLANRVYQQCYLAHTWGCHIVHEGYFYKCPQSVYVPKALGLPSDHCKADGIKLEDSPDFIHKLFEYLSSDKPLNACSHCLGNYGKERPHTIIKRKDWLPANHVYAESLLDIEKLQQSEKGIPVYDAGKELLADYSTELM